MWGNSVGTYQAGNADCGEMQLLQARNVTAWRNLAVTSQAGCYGVTANPNTAYSAINEDATSSMTYNWGYAMPGGTSSRAYMQNGYATPFGFDATDRFGTSPGFASPSVPPAPACSTAARVPSCMARVIANFTPTLRPAATYGYQPPTNRPNSNPLVPAWLCKVNLPLGLVTLGCKLAIPK